MKWHKLNRWERRALHEEYGCPLPYPLRGVDWKWQNVDENGNVTSKYTGVEALRPMAN